MIPPRPYFYGSNRTRVLLTKLEEWRHTRWQHAGARPNTMRCGIHGDCLFWVPLFKSIGALPEHLQIPDYRLREALADEMRTLRSKIEETGRAQLVWERSRIEDYRGKVADPLQALGLPWLLVGDVLIFKNGTSGAHCGLMVKAAPIHFAHLAGNGLLEEPLHQAHYTANLSCVYRLAEIEGEGR